MDVVALGAKLSKASGRLDQVDMLADGPGNRIVKRANLLDLRSYQALVRLEGRVQHILRVGNGRHKVDPFAVVNNVLGRNARRL